MGVPTYRFKLAAFALSCAFAGLAGGIHGVFVSYVTVSETFGHWLALYVILMAALGGTRHWLGPALGAAVVTALLYAFTASDFAVAGRAGRSRADPRDPVHAAGAARPVFAAQGSSPKGVDSSGRFNSGHQ